MVGTPIGDVVEYEMWLRSSFYFNFLLFFSTFRSFIGRK